MASTLAAECASVSAKLFPASKLGVNVNVEMVIVTGVPRWAAVQDWGLVAAETILPRAAAVALLALVAIPPRPERVGGL